MTPSCPTGCLHSGATRLDREAGQIVTSLRCDTCGRTLTSFPPVATPYRLEPKA